jgi:hypothetical protein
LSVAVVVAWQDRRKSSLLFLAGVLAGVTTCVLQPKGGLLLCAFVVWLWVQYRRRVTPLASIGFLAGGYAGAIGLVLLYFWSHHSLWNLINANYWWPARHYGTANVVSYAQGIFVQYWAIWVAPMKGVNWTIALATVLVIPFVLIAALPVLVPLLGALQRMNPAKPEILLYWLCGWGLWLGEMHRKDIQHLVFGSPLLLILGVYYLERNRGKIANLVLHVVAISAGCLACFNLFLVLTAHPMATRAGTAAVFKDDPALAFLDENVPRGQEIFVYPYSPMYYFLSATTNPTRWTGLGYHYNSDADFQGVIQVLDQRRVRYVVWDTLIADSARRFSPSLYRPRPDELILEPYFESHYKDVWEGNGVRIMERREDVHAN